MGLNPRRPLPPGAPPMWYSLPLQFVAMGALLGLGWYMEKDEAHRMTRFRGQSQLFAGRNPNAKEGKGPWGPEGAYPRKYI